MSHRGRKVLINSLLLTGGVVLLLIGIAIHPPETPTGFIALFLEHLGVGVFAVTVLKIFIEEAAQEQFLNLLRTDVKDQVGTTVISFIRRGSWILNNQLLKKELEDSILLPHFTRPEYTLKLTLEPLENHEDLLKVWITLEYDVKNVSDRPGTYPVGAWFDDIIKLDDLAPGSTPRFTSVQIGATVYPIESLTDVNRDPRTGRIVFEEHMIQLKDLSTPMIDPEDRISISISGMQIMRNADHFVWNLPTITHKLGLRIEVVGGLTFDLLEVYPREMHHMSHEEFIRPRPDLKTNTWTLSIDHVVLPFQGVELRWAPRRNKPSSHAAVIPSAPA